MRNEQQGRPGGRVRSQDDGEMQKRDRIGGGMFGEIGLVKFRTGCMMKNTVRRTGFLLVSLKNAITLFTAASTQSNSLWFWAK